MQSRMQMRGVPLAALLWGGVALGAPGDLPRVPAHRPVLKQTYVYKSAAGCDISADVYRLPGDDVRPALIWIHGGALIFGNREMLRTDQLDRYLGAGYAVVSIDYRLAPETKLQAIVEDVRDAYGWVSEKGPVLFSIDRDRIALVGHSAGAYLALVAGLTVRPRPRAIVSFYGYGDITGTWYGRPDPNFLKLTRVSKDDAFKAVGVKALTGSAVTPRVSFYTYLRQNALWLQEVAGLRGPDASGRLEAYCPVRHVRRDYPPTLLLHGDHDTDVPFDESVRMAAALTKRGVPNQLVVMRNYDHLFDVFPAGPGPDAEPIGLRDPRVAEAYDRVVAFLEKYVGR